MSEPYHRYPVVFEPGDPPRAGRLVFWSPDGAEPAAATGEPGELTVVLPDHVGAVRQRRVPARRLPVADALPLLVAARRAGSADPAAGYWGAAAVLALHLVARRPVRQQLVGAGVAGGGRGHPAQPGRADPRAAVRVRRAGRLDHHHPGSGRRTGARQRPGCAAAHRRDGSSG